VPVGGFLDSIPTAVFVSVHLAELAIGVWAIRSLTTGRAPYAYAFALYAISQIGFLTVFGGAITLKFGVLIEQMLVLAMVLWIALRTKRTAAA
jgi:hypothetical protein